MSGYRQDLAYIHHVGFGDYARNAAPGLVSLLRHHEILRGLVVDLGCGSGLLARELLQAGYDVLGIDISQPMIQLARAHAPGATFRNTSLLRAALPPCEAVTCAGEGLNYQFDAENGDSVRSKLFRRVWTALRPGGVFVFDFARPDRVPEPGPRRNWMEGRDWALMVEVDGNRMERTLTRRIVCFRKSGASYRRTEESHHLRLYEPAELAQELKATGFEVEELPGYGSGELLPGTSLLLAKRK